LESSRPDPLWARDVIVSCAAGVRCLDLPSMDVSQQDPTKRVTYDARLRQWFVLAYDDVRAGLVNEHLTPDRMHGFADRAPRDAIQALRQHAPWLISPALADYDWIRPVMQAGLRSAADKTSEESVAAAADELLDRLIAEPGLDAAQYAVTLSGRILADFLGVDRRDSRYLVAWAHDLMAFFNDPEVTTARTERMARSASDMVAYAQGLLAERRENGRGGFLDLAARRAAARGRVLDDESIGNITLPFLTGHVGVAHLMANAVWLLLTHEGQWQRVAEHPNLLAGAIAETLRLTPPVALAPRVAVDRTTIAGHVVDAGEGVQLSIAAANRDPTHFTDADRFDITRSQGGALGFGYGAHSCIAAGISRTQAAIGLRALLGRAPQLVLDPGGDVRWSPIEGLRALQTLPVRATPPSRRAS
jgi:cytochrome P450